MATAAARCRLSRMARESCAACHDPVPTSKLCKVVIDGRVVGLCRTHAGIVAAERPDTFDEMRSLFKEPVTDTLTKPRRSMIDRRKTEDRRILPPRPEGRRASDGRRSTDRS